MKVPPETRALVAPLAGVGRDFPLSIEKLCPVLAFYVVKDWHEGCERVLQLLRYGGTGHTMAIHSKDDAVIREFALKKPVFRIVANSQSSMGATGYTTGLAPSMSLGCGAYAGNITSDNITPLHLINIKRLAYELPRDRRPGAGGAPSRPGPATSRLEWPRSWPNAWAAPRRLRPRRSRRLPRRRPRPPARRRFRGRRRRSRAIREGRTITSAGAIVTPAARDLADGKNVLVDER